MNSFLVYCVVIAAVMVALRADAQRRRLSLKRSAGWKLLTILDVAGVIFTIAFAVFFLARNSAFLIFAGALFVLVFLALRRKV